MKNRETLDITNSDEEFKKLNNRLRLLSDRFTAVAMDYKHFIDSSFKENKIFELRDGVQYRLFSVRVHLELLLNQHLIIEDRLKLSLANGPSTPFIDSYQQEISSIFDSIIYHTVSIFDYLSTLTNYISSKSQDTLMWTQLVRSIRDKKNKLSNTKYSSTIDFIDREFVDKLYNHRSLIIHRKGDRGNSSITYNYGSKGNNVDVYFFAGSNIINRFKELKLMSIDKHLSIRYVSFWILNKTIDKVTDILFSLKEEIEANKIVSKPMMFYLNPMANEQQPISVNYWHETEYFDEKKKNGL